MILRTLGENGPVVSEIGLGTLHFGAFLDERQSTALVHQALDQDVNFFDTAPIYGNARSESILGRALRGKRSKAIVSTKVGLKAIRHPNGRFGVKALPLTAEFVKVSVESSLRALQVETIDVLQLHAFDHETPLAETFRGLEDMIQAGKIQYFGSSNYSRPELETIIGRMPSSLIDKHISVQAHYNLLERRAETCLLPQCRISSLGLIVNRVFARGVLTGKYVLGKQFPAQSRGVLSPRVRETITPDVLEIVAALADFARSCGRNCSELALRWAMRKPEISLALVGVRNCAQLETCLNACDWNLSPDELAAVEEIVSRFGFDQRVHEMPAVFFEQ